MAAIKASGEFQFLFKYRIVAVHGVYKRFAKDGRIVGEGVYEAV
jgi:hypothetical protein